MAQPDNDIRLSQRRFRHRQPVHRISGEHDLSATVRSSACDLRPHARPPIARVKTAAAVRACGDACYLKQSLDICICPHHRR